MRKDRRALLVMAMALGLAVAASAPVGASASAAPAARPLAGQLHIAAAVADAADPFYLTMKCGAQAAARKLGVSLSWEGSASVDVGPELTTLDAVEQTHPNGIILAPFSPITFVQPVRQLMAHGTPVVTVDGSLAKKVEVENVHTQNYGAGEAAGRYLGRLLHGKGIVGVISFEPGIPVEAARVNGFLHVMKTQFPHVQILGTQYGHADSATSASITASLIEAHPGLSGMYVTDLTDASGAGSAIFAAHKRGTIKLVAYDAEPLEVRGLATGLFDALIAQDPYAEGYRAVTVLTQLLRHQISRRSIPYYYPTGWTVITRQNAHAAAVRPYEYTTSC